MSDDSEAQLNDTFIYIIRVAEDDENVCATLLKILSLSSENRKMAVENLVSDLKSQRAPKDFIEAIAYLSDDDIANTALEKIKSIRH